MIDLLLSVVTSSVNPFIWLWHYCIAKPFSLIHKNSHDDCEHHWLPIQSTHATNNTTEFTGSVGFPIEFAKKVDAIYSHTTTSPFTTMAPSGASRFYGSTGYYDNTEYDHYPYPTTTPPPPPSPPRPNIEGERLINLD
ncbi:MAG: hypothetical protein M0R50_06010 [Candidatus Cloacimonetes bacterium]|jgi:hypothetical protein|nr:hypothetical protein [Candidatus Cloacimonadota bacterium]